jgi:hypothetical protein
VETDLKDAVREKYASVATRRRQKAAEEEVALAQAFGYSEGQLDSIST